MLKKLHRRLSTEAGAPDSRQRQYAVMVLVAVIAATAASVVFGLHTGGLIAGITAVLALIAAGGRSLRSDLRRFISFVPILVLIMGGGPLLTASPLLAGSLVALVVFGAGLLPAFGEQYRVGGQTIGAATLVATTTGIGTDQPPSILFGAAGAGAVFALVLRIVLGLGDTGKATRRAVASTLVEIGPGVMERATAAWHADGALSWLGEVLAGSARIRAARQILLAQAERAHEAKAHLLRQIVEETDRITAELATAVRSRSCTGLPLSARADPAEAVRGREDHNLAAAEDLPDAARALNEGLDRIRAAVVHRGKSTATRPRPGARRQRVRCALSAHLSLRSSLFRHALRCTLAVGAGMVIVMLMRDLSASALLLSLYFVLQPAARDSMTGALERTGAVVLGVVALAAIIAVLPTASFLLPITIAAMLLGVERMRFDNRVLLASLIALTVVDRTTHLDRPVTNVAISFAANTAIAAATALIIGFISYVVLPSSVIPDVRGSVRATVWSVSELLRCLRAATGEKSSWTALRSAHTLAMRRTQDLLGLPAFLDNPEADPEHERATRTAALALDALRQDIVLLAFRPATERMDAHAAMRSADELLSGRMKAKIPDVPSGNAPATELVASSLIESALYARAAIDHTLGHQEPWKRYHVSFISPPKRAESTMESPQGTL